MEFILVDTFKISKKSEWDKLFIQIKKQEIEIRDNKTKRADGILFANINKNNEIINGYVNWNWTDKKTLCKSHKLNKKGGINFNTIEETLKFIGNSDLKIVLSKGYDNVLETDPKLINSLSIKNKVYHLNSKDAIEQFNVEVIKCNPVVIFLHSTC